MNVLFLLVSATPANCITMQSRIPVVRRGTEVFGGLRLPEGSLTSLHVVDWMSPPVGVPWA